MSADRSTSARGGGGRGAGGVVRIGAGAGFSGDRIDPAVDLAERGDLDYLVFECLAERTIALAHAVRRHRPEAGYDPLLDARMRRVLPPARAAGTRIVTNMGAANPAAAARAVVQIARDIGLAGLRVAAVEGDDVFEEVLAAPLSLIDSPGTTADLSDAIVSANAYLGAGPIAKALDEGADVVITGRVGDPALFLGPLVHAFGWRPDDWDRLGRGTLVGHLLECAGQLTGGYFADPGYKDVFGLARLGFPFAEVTEDGSAVLAKLPETGGLLSVATCTEQLLYEVQDPRAYVQADVTADFSNVWFDPVGEDRVRVSGGAGRAAPTALKVSVGYRDGFIGEGQISYAGPGAVERGRLAIDIVRERLALTGIAVRDLRGELIGVDAVDRRDPASSQPAEVRARLVARADRHEDAARVGAEVEALYTNGPAGGGGATGGAHEVLAIASALIDRDAVRPRLTMFES